MDTIKTGVEKTQKSKWAIPFAPPDHPIYSSGPILGQVSSKQFSRNTPESDFSRKLPKQPQPTDSEQTSPDDSLNQTVIE